MLGWVIALHDDVAYQALAGLEHVYGSVVACRVVNYWHGLSTNMLSRMMCDALHHTDRGEGVVFLIDRQGSAPYRAAALLSHKHSHCEVISGVTPQLLLESYSLRERCDSRAFREAIVARGRGTVSSLWHEQQKNPPFVLLHDPQAL